MICAAWLGQRPAQIDLGDLLIEDRHLNPESQRGRPAPGNIDENVVGVHPGHLLGGMDGVGDRRLGVLDVDDRPGPHALGAGVPETDNLDRRRIIGAGDQAAYLARADVERGDGPAVRSFFRFLSRNISHDSNPLLSTDRRALLGGAAR